MKAAHLAGSRGHDIGGHMLGTQDDELATRWFRFDAFSPINQLHSTHGIFNGKEPWRHHAITEKIQGDFLRLHNRIVPLLLTKHLLGVLRELVLALA